MKKILALVLVFIMAFSLVACASNTAAPVAEETKAEVAEEKAEQNEAAPAETEAVAEEKQFDGVNLKLWMVPFKSDAEDRTFWETELADFTNQTGANVELEIVGWGDIGTKYLTGFMSGNAADVMYMTDEFAYDFINQGCLADLTPYWSEEEIANENFWDTAAYGTGHYKAPYVGGSAYRGYTFNMDILNKCGITEVPQTWDEFIAACEAVKKGAPDVYPFLTPFSGASVSVFYNFFTLLYQNGGALVNDDVTAYTVNTPEGLEAMNLLKGLVDDGYLSTDCLGLEVGNVRDLFMEGKVACTIDDPSIFLSSDLPFEWESTSAIGKKRGVSYNAIDSLSASADSANLDAAVALLKFMRSDKVVTDFFTLFQSAQLVKTWPATTPDPRVADLFAHPERSILTPVAPNIQLVCDSIATNQQLVVMNQITAEEALAQIQAEADKAFK